MNAIGRKIMRHADQVAYLEAHAVHGADQHARRWPRPQPPPGRGILRPGVFAARSICRSGAIPSSSVSRARCASRGRTSSSTTTPANRSWWCGHRRACCGRSSFAAIARQRRDQAVRLQQARLRLSLSRLGLRPDGPSGRHHRRRRRSAISTRAPHGLRRLKVVEKYGHWSGGARALGRRGDGELRHRPHSAMQPDLAGWDMELGWELHSLSRSGCA